MQPSCRLSRSICCVLDLLSLGYGKFCNLNNLNSMTVQMNPLLTRSTVEVNSHVPNVRASSNASCANASLSSPPEKFESGDLSMWGTFRTRGRKVRLRSPSRTMRELGRGTICLDQRLASFNH
jgi:hypothetical protein